MTEGERFGASLPSRAARAPPGSRRRDPAQIEDRKERVEAAGAACPARQDRRGEADPVRLPGGAAIPDLHARDRDRPDPGLDHALEDADFRRPATSMTCAAVPKSGARSRERTPAPG